MGDQQPPRGVNISAQRTDFQSNARHGFEPTADQRALVRRLVREGATKTSIAATLGIARLTLRRHLAAELGIKPPEPKTMGTNGRPEFEPTARMRADVASLKAARWSDQRIAVCLGISRNTLLKYFAGELATGRDRRADAAPAAGKVVLDAGCERRSPSHAPEGITDRVSVEDTIAAHPGAEYDCLRLHGPVSCATQRQSRGNTPKAHPRDVGARAISDPRMRFDRLLAPVDGFTMTNPIVYQVTKSSSAVATQRAAFGLRELKFSNGRSFAGYGAVFGNVDACGDVIAAGAFARTLQEHAAAGTMPAMLAQHGDWTGTGDGMMPIGVWTKLDQDEHGLLVEGRLSDTPRGNEAYTLLKDKALTGLSIGYTARKYRLGTKAGEPRRTLTDVELVEISLVTFPANDRARVDSVKVAGKQFTPRDCEQILRDAGVPRGLAKAVVAKGWRAATDQLEADGEAATATEMVAALKASAATLNEFLKRTF